MLSTPYISAYVADVKPTPTGWMTPFRARQSVVMVKVSNQDGHIKCALHRIKFKSGTRQAKSSPGCATLDNGPNE